MMTRLDEVVGPAFQSLIGRLQTAIAPIEEAAVYAVSIPHR